MIVAFSVTPLGVGEGVSGAVARLSRSLPSYDRR